MSSKLKKLKLIGYETEVPTHVQPAECQQRCSYGIDHTDAPIDKKFSN